MKSVFVRPSLSAFSSFLLQNFKQRPVIALLLVATLSGTMFSLARLTFAQGTNSIPVTVAGSGAGGNAGGPTGLGRFSASPSQEPTPNQECTVTAPGQTPGPWSGPSWSWSGVTVTPLGDAPSGGLGVESVAPFDRPSLETRLSYLKPGRYRATATATVSYSSNCGSKSGSGTGSFEVTIEGKKWTKGSAITGGDLSEPAGEGPFVVDEGAEVAVGVTEASDSDHWTMGSQSGDEADTVTYNWTSAGGKFKGEDGKVVSSVTTRGATWVAPNLADTTASQEFTLTCTVDDTPKAPGANEAGTRDDDALTRTVKVKVVQKVWDTKNQAGEDGISGSEPVRYKTEDDTLGAEVPDMVDVAPGGSFSLELSPSSDSDHWKRGTAGADEEGHDDDTLTYKWKTSGGGGFGGFGPVQPPDGAGPGWTPLPGSDKFEDEAEGESVTFTAGPLPDKVASVTMTLTATIDDTPKPKGEKDGGTRNDTEKTVNVTVRIIRNQKEWEPGTPIEGGAVVKPANQTGTVTTPSVVEQGHEIELEVAEATDIDRWTQREEEGTDPDTITYKWDETGAGELGGTFTAPDARSTRWRAPPLPVGIDTYNATLNITIDDTPKELGENEIGKRDDDKITHTIRVLVKRRMWEERPALAQHRATGGPQAGQLVPDGRMVAPQDQRVAGYDKNVEIVLPLGAQVPCSVEGATDLDTLVQVNGDEAEHADTVNYKWTAEGAGATGSTWRWQEMEDGQLVTKTGSSAPVASATWIAPDDIDEEKQVTLKCTLDDKPGDINAPLEGGKRDDQKVERTVKAKVVPLDIEIDTVDRDALCAGGIGLGGDYGSIENNPHQTNVHVTVKQGEVLVQNQEVAFRLRSSKTAKAGEENEVSASLSASASETRDGDLIVRTDAEGVARVVLTSGVKVEEFDLEASITGSFGTVTKKEDIKVEKAEAEWDAEEIEEDAKGDPIIRIKLKYDDLPVNGHPIAWRIDEVTRVAGNVVPTAEIGRHAQLSGLISTTGRAGTPGEAAAYVRLAWSVKQMRYNANDQVIKVEAEPSEPVPPVANDARIAFDATGNPAPGETTETLVDQKHDDDANVELKREEWEAEESEPQVTSGQPIDTTVEEDEGIIDDEDAPEDRDVPVLFENEFNVSFAASDLFEQRRDPVTGEVTWVVKQLDDEDVVALLTGESQSPQEGSNDSTRSDAGFSAETNGVQNDLGRDLEFYRDFIGSFILENFKEQLNGQRAVRFAIAGKGLVVGAYKQGADTVDAVTHPLETLQGLQIVVTGALSPAERDRFKRELDKEFQKLYRDSTTGNAHVTTKVISEVGGRIIFEVALTKGTGRLLASARAANLASKGRLVARMRPVASLRNLGRIRLVSQLTSRGLRIQAKGLTVKGAFKGGQAAAEQFAFRVLKSPGAKVSYYLGKSKEYVTTVSRPRVLGHIWQNRRIPCRYARVVYKIDAVTKKLKITRVRLLRYVACFTAGTPILMADGTHKVIEQVKAGDMVMSRDEVAGATNAQRVTQTFERQAEATLMLGFSNGEQIETTKEHPFFVEHKGFTPAGELGIGTSIVTRAGPNAALASTEVRERAATVYNFEVENTHTYFVGYSNLWVHNVCKVIASSTFWNHVLWGEGIKGRLFVGAHRLDAFESKIAAGLVREVPGSTRHKVAEGIYEIRYQTAKMDGSGGWKAEAPDPKTVFDPQIVPEWEFKDLMLKAAKQGLDTGTYSGNFLKGVAPNGLKMNFRTVGNIDLNAPNIELNTAYFVK